MDLYEAFNRNLTAGITLTEAELSHVRQYFQHKKYRKKSILLSKGEVCDFEAYLIKGCVKRYYIDQSDNEIVLQFATEDWWVSDLVSFTAQVPSLMFIETMEDTELLQISHQDKELLFKELPQIERAFRLLVQRAYATLEERFFTGISDTAEERYVNFIKKYPSLPQRVPQYQIASYLGITPEALSRIKAQLVRKK